MEPKRFKSRLIGLKDIKILDQNELRWNYGAIYKNRADLIKIEHLDSFKA